MLSSTYGFLENHRERKHAVLNRVFAAPQVTVYRDSLLGDEFPWVPTGYCQYFRIEIRLKSPLKDVKVTKQASNSGII
jgi:hypothetical protein